MLAELAAFNGAYATIKAALSNGRELSDCIKQIGTIVGAKADLQEKANKRKHGFFAKLKGQTADDLEEFLAREKIKEAEATLQQLMIYTGRPGLWADWQRFQAEARKERIRAREEAEKARERLIEIAGYVFAGVLVLGAIVAFFFYIRWLKGS